MADLDNVTSEWVPGIRQLEETDPVLGGPPNETTGDGIDNIPHFQLAKRTQYLKAELESRTSANAILAAVLGLDGPGSGLNADLLDGQHASYFARATDLASSTSDTAIIAAVKRQDGAGSGVDADLLDGKQASAFLEKSGGTMTGSITLPGNPSANSHAATKQYVDAQRDSRAPASHTHDDRYYTKSQSESRYSSSGHTHDGRYVNKSGDSMSGNLSVAGTVFSHGDEVLVWSDTVFAVDSIVLARYDGSVEKFYGAETDGSTLQPCAGNGNENVGPIGVGTWVCLGHAKQDNGSFSSADRTTLWFRKF